MRNTVFKLAIKSIRYRRSTIFLSIFSIALSVMLLLGIERIRSKVEESFTSTISGTDLIVGARTGNISLLLSTVFHIGNASQNVSWESYQKISRLPQVDWTIPIALGDSHKGYSVIGTTPEFFQHFKYSADLLLSTRSGETNISNMYCVIGSQVAKKLGYAVNDPIILTHGMGSEDFLTHEDDPFEIAGVLAPTGTPIDNSILISLSSLDHIHEEFYQYDKKNVNVFGNFDYKRDRSAAQVQEIKEQNEGINHEHDHPHEKDGHSHDSNTQHDHGHEEDHDQEHETAHDHDHGEPGSITGFFLGVKNKSDILVLQRTINEEKDEALLAILPVVTLLELWNIINPIEKILLIISLLVLIVSLGSVLTSIISSLNQRRREMSVLRSVGAHPGYIFGLIIIESTGIVITGIVTGIILLLIALVITKPILAQNFGMILEIGQFTQGELLILVVIFVAGILVGLIPAISSYRRTLSDGLTIKI
ncbi:ABC transporter permease [Winogradskyella aurantiaca]|uniref:ABC transporter permease n=1 Tax=Winogradskyella aurantiaca TaxID=2219558 RepID=UPI000E1DC038|nr:FtsX-like permease family protein [Winogradskyella aurantiaca]